MNEDENYMRDRATESRRKRYSNICVRWVFPLLLIAAVITGAVYFYAYRRIPAEPIPAPPPTETKPAVNATYQANLT